DRLSRAPVGRGRGPALRRLQRRARAGAWCEKIRSWTILESPIGRTAKESLPSWHLVGGGPLGKSRTMTTAILTHTACLYHEVPAGHPESPDRLRAVLAATEAEEFTDLHREEAPAASLETVARVHSYAQRLLAALPAQGLAHIDADTVASPGSGEA